jgi:hypothetical protein
MTTLTLTYRSAFVAAATYKETTPSRREADRIVQQEADERMSDAAAKLAACEPEWFTFRGHTFEGSTFNFIVRRNESWAPSAKTMKMLRGQRLKTVLIESVLQDLVDHCETLEELLEYLSVNKPHLLYIAEGLVPKLIGIDEDENPSPFTAADRWAPHGLLFASCLLMLAVFLTVLS